MELPTNIKYTKEHEWVKVDGTTATVGITEYAQGELGDIVFVDLPDVGKKLTPGQSFCVLESTKAASDVYAPISGTVASVNAALSDNPTEVNHSPYEKGWLATFADINSAELDSLMSAEQYKAFIKK